MAPCLPLGMQNRSGGQHWTAVSGLGYCRPPRSHLHSHNGNRFPQSGKPSQNSTLFPLESCNPSLSWQQWCQHIRCQWQTEHYHKCRPSLPSCDGQCAAGLVSIWRQRTRTLVCCSHHTSQCHAPWCRPAVVCAGHPVHYVSLMQLSRMALHDHLLHDHRHSRKAGSGLAGWDQALGLEQSKDPDICLAEGEAGWRNNTSSCLPHRAGISSPGTCTGADGSASPWNQPVVHICSSLSVSLCPVVGTHQSHGDCQRNLSPQHPMLPWTLRLVVLWVSGDSNVPARGWELAGRKPPEMPWRHVSDQRVASHPSCTRFFSSGPPCCLSYSSCLARHAATPCSAVSLHALQDLPNCP